MASSFKEPFATEVTPDSVDDDPTTAADHRKAQEEEYGKYVAATRIDIDGVLAFMPGHAVPVGHVSDEGPVYPSQVMLREEPPAKTSAKASTAKASTKDSAPAEDTATPADKS